MILMKIITLSIVAKIIMCGTNENINIDINNNYYNKKYQLQQ